ncbi:MAG: hypothetical protein NTV15_01620 [Candidatus Bathyarchaeota archaeon]|nr:hypothetical protein [Candidatus Bathyarchaeota archaeon]
MSIDEAFKGIRERISQSPVEDNSARRLTILKSLSSSISSYQILKLRLSGSVHIGDFMLPGWSGKLPFYAFKCEKHGFVANYPEGHDEILRCPFCED